MAVFYSFHYDRDAMRVQQIIQMGALEGQTILNAQRWEEVKRRGDQAIKDWIEKEMKYKSAVVVLVGRQTAERPWVRHEILHAWNNRKPLVGIRIHGLADPRTGTDSPGPNPFERLRFDSGGSIADYVTLWTPAGSTGQQVHASIRNNLVSWVNSAYKRP